MEQELGARIHELGGAYIFGGARLPHDLRILTKLLTFAHPNAG